VIIVAGEPGKRPRIHSPSCKDKLLTSYTVSQPEQHYVRYCWGAEGPLTEIIWWQPVWVTAQNQDPIEVWVITRNCTGCQAVAHWDLVGLPGNFIQMGAVSEGLGCETGAPMRTWSLWNLYAGSVETLVTSEETVMTRRIAWEKSDWDWRNE
jgi:hypothetical protein